MSPLNLLLLAGEAAAASVALPLMAGLLARAYPRSAARRRLAWTAMFAVLLALPAAAALSPSLAVLTLAAPHPGAPAAAAGPAAAALSSAEAAVLLALAAWGAGALWLLARALVARIGLERLRRASRPADAQRLPLDMPKGCAVRLSPDGSGPMTWGAVRPVILLPDDALDWPAERLKAALRHELAHVRARDSLVQALALLACALYWPNPLVRRAAAASGVRPSDYAAQLLDLARDWRGPDAARPQPWASLAMASPPILTERVQSILSPDASRTGATPMDTFKLALVGGAALAALALARPSIAQVAAPPAPAAPAASAGQSITVPYNQATDDPASPGYIAPGQPGAGHPVPAELAKRLNARKDGATAPWTLDWQPAAAAPPAPEAAQASPAPAAKLAEAEPAPGTRIAVRIHDDGVGAVQGPGDKEASMTPEQQAELNRKLAEIGPRIEKALKDAHIQETVAKALKDAHIDETVAKALKDANVAEIIAHSRVDLSVDQGQGQGQGAAKP
jgi:hypothetical protein